MTDVLKAQLAEVRNASRKTEGWIARRNQAIRTAHTTGASLRELADAASLSHMTIKRIIQREEQL